MGTGFKKREHLLNVYCVVLKSLNTTSLNLLSKSRCYSRFTDKETNIQVNK